jgi:hypothetical protein
MGAGPLCDVCAFVGCGEEGDSPECRVCIVDGSQGVYVPRAFATNFNMTDWHVREADVTALLAGPESDEYWEVWSDLSDYGGAHFVDAKGVRWELEQNGDLFARAVNAPTRDSAEETEAR